MKNLFELGQQVRQKNMSEERTFVVTEISLLVGGVIAYTGTETDLLHEESELELAKEKRKVELFAPIRKVRQGIVFYSDYYESKEAYHDHGDTVGWHSIEVEIEEG